MLALNPAGTRRLEKLIMQFARCPSEAPRLPPPKHPTVSSMLEDAPTSTSLLLQCGYRSKVCTSHRATKLDGTLHKLCEFHRRKANFNQQKLHKRHREERARREATEGIKPRAAKKTKTARVSVKIEPSASASFQVGLSAGESAFPDLAAADMDLLELLLLDMHTLPPLEPFETNPLAPVSTSHDEGSVVIV